MFHFIILPLHHCPLPFYLPAYQTISHICKTLFCQQIADCFQNRFEEFLVRLCQRHWLCFHSSDRHCLLSLSCMMKSSEADRCSFVVRVAILKRITKWSVETDSIASLPASLGDICRKLLQFVASAVMLPPSSTLPKTYFIFAVPAYASLPKTSTGIEINTHHSDRLRVANTLIF